MGSYNTLTYRCPACGKSAEFQSKAGCITMRKYTLYNAPLFTLADFHDDAAQGDLFCSECHERLDVRVGVTVRISKHSDEGGVTRDFDSRVNREEEDD